MNLCIYSFKKLNSCTEYIFESKGPKGELKIKVNFIESSKKNIYELEFGLFNEPDNSINQEVILNNGDTTIIINTVFMIVHDFSVNKPNALIRFSGSTKARTRLFNIWMNRNTKIRDEYFISYGYREHTLWTLYKKGVKYEAMMLKKMPINS